MAQMRRLIWLTLIRKRVDPPLFEPMAGVFAPDKKRYYAEVGGFLLLCLIAAQRGIYSSPFNSWVTKKSI